MDELQVERYGMQIIIYTPFRIQHREDPYMSMEICNQEIKLRSIVTAVVYIRLLLSLSRGISYSSHSSFTIIPPDYNKTASLTMQSLPRLKFRHTPFHA